MNFSGGDLEEKIKTTLISSATYVFGNIFIRTFLERMFGSLSSAYVLSPVSYTHLTLPTKA